MEDVVPRLSGDVCWVLCQLSRRLLLLLLCLLRQTSTASARSQCSPPGPNSKPRIKAFPPGPNRKLRVRAFPAGTSTASARLRRSPPDPNSKLTIRVFPAEPQLQALDHSVPAGPKQQAPHQSGVCRTSIASAIDPSVPHRTRTASSRSECAPPDLTCKR